MSAKSRLARIEKRLPLKPRERPRYDLLRNTRELPDALVLYVVNRCDPRDESKDDPGNVRLKHWLGRAAGYDDPEDDDWCLNALAKTTWRVGSFPGRVPTLDELHAALLHAAQLRLSAWLHPPPHKWARGFNQDRLAWEALVGPITEDFLSERDTMCHHMFDDDVVRRWRTRPGGPSAAIVELAGLDEHTVRFSDSA